MKFTVTTILLLVTAINAKDDPSGTQKNTENVKTEKRAIAEGNARVQKRAPLLATAIPSPVPGIEYADTKSLETDKSPAQQIYATEVPQLAKISDVLSGHGVPFQTAITSHLYSPVSVYTARLASPTTYEVSAPVPSQLAYAEKIAIRPVQYIPQAQYDPRPVTITLQPVYQQQQIANPQQGIQQVPYFQSLNQRLQQQPIQYQNPQLIYSQIQQRQSQIAQNGQPGITYARLEETKAQRPIQRELKKNIETKVLEKLTFAPKQNYDNVRNLQNQGAVSYASISQGLPSYQPQQEPKYQEQKPQDTQPLYQQPHQYQSQNSYQTPQYQAPPQYQIQTQFQERPQFLIQSYAPQLVPQFQNQGQPQYFSPQANTIISSNKDLSRARTLYIRPQPINQPQIYQVQEVLQTPVLDGQPAPVAPTFPPVQYFGKYAEEIFGNYEH